MTRLKKITLSSNPRRFVRDTVFFLRKNPGCVAIASGPPCSGKTEFALRCAYHLSSQKRVLFLSGEMHPNALARRLASIYEPEQLNRRHAIILVPAYCGSMREICEKIAEHPSPFVVIDGLSSMIAVRTDFEAFVSNANISVLVTTTETKRTKEGN